MNRNKLLTYAKLVRKRLGSKCPQRIVLFCSGNYTLFSSKMDIIKYVLDNGTLQIPSNDICSFLNEAINYSDYGNNDPKSKLADGNLEYIGRKLRQYATRISNDPKYCKLNSRYKDVKQIVRNKRLNSCRLKLNNPKKCNSALYAYKYPVKAVDYTADADWISHYFSEYSATELVFFVAMLALLVCFPNAVWIFAAIVAMGIFLSVVGA